MTAGNERPLVVRRQFRPLEERWESERIRAEKIRSLQAKYAHVRDSIREKLGLQEEDEDNFCLCLYGSCIRSDKDPTVDSDIDGYFFYYNPHDFQADSLAYLTFDYEIVEDFDTQAQSIFGKPQGAKDRDNDGSEDIEPRDIYKLIKDIETNQRLTDRELKGIAIIFSPQFIGNRDFIASLKASVMKALAARTGKKFDKLEWNYLRDRGVKAYQKRYKSGIYGDFEDFIADGETIWKFIQEKYKYLFQASLPAFGSLVESISA